MKHLGIKNAEQPSTLHDLIRRRETAVGQGEARQQDGAQAVSADPPGGQISAGSAAPVRPQAGQAGGQAPERRVGAHAGHHRALEGSAGVCIAEKACRAPPVPRGEVERGGIIPVPPPPQQSAAVYGSTAFM
jgi:hypothetical protein